MEEQQLSDKQKKLLGNLKSKYFHFNIPNYVASDFLEILPPNLTYLIQGREVAPTTGTPHLQCYLNKFYYSILVIYFYLSLS